MSAPAERNEAYFQQFVGSKIDKSIFRVKGKDLVAYAKSIGDFNPIYYVEEKEGEKPDYSTIVAHPAYAATYTIPALFKLADVKGKDGQPMIKNIGKLLHTGQEYDFSGCPPITTAYDKIYSEGEVSKVFIKSEILWIEIKVKTTSKEGDKLFCKTTCTVGIRKGGY